MRVREVSTGTERDSGDPSEEVVSNLRGWA